MQLELFKAEQVNVYKDIESIDIAEIVDPTTGELVLKNVKKDAYYLYKTGCPHKILKDEGDIFPGVYSKVSGKFLKLHFEYKCQINLNNLITQETLCLQNEIVGCNTCQCSL